MPVAAAQLISQYRYWWKAEWTKLLHEIPPVSPLGAPAIMVHAIDGTISEFLNILSSQEPRRTGGDAAATLARLCRCGLNPWLSFFTSGEAALRRVAGELDRHERAQVLTLFNRLAWERAAPLCEICPKRTAFSATPPKRVRRKTVARSRAGGRNLASSCMAGRRT